MRVAVYPGSFDPITKGHLDIINRASKLFDKVIVLVSINVVKSYVFSKEERVQMIRSCTTTLENVTVDTFSGLLADYVSQVDACAIVKGLRAVSDFEYEFQQALANKKLNAQAETVFLTTTAEHMFLSSSLVKQIAYFHGNISDFVPDEILQTVVLRLEQKSIENGG